MKQLFTGQIHKMGPDVQTTTSEILEHVTKTATTTDNVNIDQENELTLLQL